jgi:hypothetical protein
MEKLTRHWGVDVEQIGFGVQNLGGLLDDVQCVFLFDPPLPVEMVLEIGDVRHALFRLGKELVVGRDVHSRGLDLRQHARHARMQYVFRQSAYRRGFRAGWKDLFDDPLLGADGEAVFELMLSKIDILGRTPALDLLDSPL